MFFFCYQHALERAQIFSTLQQILGKRDKSVCFACLVLCSHPDLARSKNPTWLLIDNCMLIDEPFSIVRKVVLRFDFFNYFFQIFVDRLLHEVPEYDFQR